MGSMLGKPAQRTTAVARTQKRVVGCFEVAHDPETRLPSGRGPGCDIEDSAPKLIFQDADRTPVHLLARS